MDFHESEVDMSVGARFNRVIAALPQEHVAYQDGDRSFTYRELDDLSLALAARLHSHLPPTNSDSEAETGVVAIYLDTSFWVLVAMYGALRAQFCYTPVDRQLGPAWARRVMDTCRPAAVVTISDLAHEVLELMPEGLIPILVCLDTMPRAPVVFNAPPTDATSWAGVFFSSGSTGKPRGIVRTHAQHIYTSYQKFVDVRFGPTDRIAFGLSFAHAFSGVPLAAGIMNGATLYSASYAGSPATLYRELHASRITVLPAPLGTIRALADQAVLKGPLPDLRLIVFGGEAMTRADAEKALGLMGPGGVLQVQLASTEADTYARCLIRSADELTTETVPAGTPPVLKKVLLLDEAMRPVAVGAPGEIAVQSRILAAGYFCDPRTTADKFFPDPTGGNERVLLTGDIGLLDENGLLRVVGRKDNMVKIRGFRVQLEEVDSTINALTDVAEAIVIARPDPRGSNRLIAFVVPRKSVTVDTLRGELAGAIPTYMIPDRFVFLQQLPRGPSGKIDRAKLPVVSAVRPDLSVQFVAPRTTAERAICDLLARVLELDRVGIHDPLQALGVDSLLMVQVLFELERTFAVELSDGPAYGSTAAELLRSVERLSTRPVVRAAPGRSLVVAARLAHWRQRVIRHTSGKLDPHMLILAARYPFERVTLFLPLKVGLRWLWFWSFLAELFLKLYSSEQMLFRRFGAEVADPTDGRCFRTNLVGELLHRALLDTFPRGAGLWHMTTQSVGWPFFRALAKLIRSNDAAEIGSLFRVSGMKHFLDACTAQRGVIVVSFHTSVGRIALQAAMQLAGVESAHTVSVFSSSAQQKLQRRSVATTDAAGSAAWSAGLLVKAARMVRDGRTVVFYPDLPDQVPDGHPVQWAGRAKRIRAGFATLALESGAPVIPTYSTVAADGRLETRFFAPFDCGYDNAPRQDRISVLLRQYARFVERAWREAPESVPWFVMHKHLRSPRTEPQASDGVVTTSDGPA